MSYSMIDLLVDFHRTAYRQGPGSDEETKRALSFIQAQGVDKRIADIGCGTGAQTMVLAEQISGHITAIDMLPGFLEELARKIEKANLGDRVVPLEASMMDLPFKDGELDLIWAEGSIYHIGFQRGINEWRRFLKQGAYLVVSEISWLTAERPTEIENYWLSQYAEMDTISSKIKQIEQAGYTSIAHFVLPETCWLDNYYLPIAEREEAFLEKYNYTDAVKELIEIGKQEREIYYKYKDYYSYVFYIAKKQSKKNARNLAEF